MDGAIRKTTQMRRLLAGGEVVVSPGVYDGYSLRLAERAGFQTASTSGAGIANSRLGVQDTGMMSLHENVDACRALAATATIPLMADADTGYGNAVTVFHAVRMFEDAGVVGINIEDQEFPKRCGHMKGKELIHPLEMAKKIEAAARGRRDADFIINARTDAIAVEGIEAAVERAKLYAAAGADMIFPDAVRGEDDIRRICDAVPVAVSINIGFGIRSRPTTPLIPVRRLKELGVRRVSVPRMLPAAALRAMEGALGLLRHALETGEVVDRPDLLFSIDEIKRLMDYESLERLEEEFLLPEQLHRKYQAGKAMI
ncbi:isocitrate lyase/PEP mutase family protein [Falsiroseomonas sp. CW058]|uniref:isocitrate lyase/PEP mutase family protein n=1 Tax=Falsiroseomonas sp. CW058 TaxID=3388664 RepID=UPI003D3165FA